jgi:hypothetical protein
LLRAAQGGHLKCVELLLEYGASVGAQDKAGRTPLLCTLADAHEDVRVVMMMMMVVTILVLCHHHHHHHDGRRHRHPDALDELGGCAHSLRRMRR